MPQRARTFKVDCCLKVHNAHLKLLSPISGYSHRYWPRISNFFQNSVNYITSY